MSEGKIDIAMFPSDSYGCGYYRLIMPAFKMKALFDDSVSMTVERPGKFGEALKKHDIYHFQRTVTPDGLEAMRLAKKKGSVILDIDDDILNLYPGHASAWYYRKGKQCRSCGNSRLGTSASSCPVCGSADLQYQDRIECFRKAVELADCITVSTPELYYAYACKSKRCEIIPNYLDMSMYSKLQPRSTDITVVGWAGSSTHSLDLTEVIPYLGVLNAYKSVVFMGTGDKDLGSRIKKYVDPKKVFIMHPVTTMEYPALINNFDIGLAPLVDNRFNRCKSPLKAEEYNAVGAVFLASDVAPYNRYRTVDGGVGALVSKPKYWIRELKNALSVMEDPESKLKYRRAALNKANTLNIDGKLQERLDLYLSVMESRNN